MATVKAREKPSPREKRFVQNVVKGMKHTKAAREAGYSYAAAHSNAHEIIRRPRVESYLTLALEAAGLTPAKTVQPILDALAAKKSINVLGQGLVESDVPDHPVRLSAVDRIVDLYGQKPREVEMPAPVRPGLVVVIGRESDVSKKSTDSSSPDRPTPAGKTFAVSFTREEG